MQNIQALIYSFGGIINTVIKLGVAVGLLVFLWGLATTVLMGANENAQKEGRNRMVWGLIALFIMLSVWGLVDYVSIAIFGHGLERQDPNAMYGNNV